MPHPAHTSHAARRDSSHHGHSGSHTDIATTIDDIISNLSEIAIEEQTEPNGNARYVLGDRNRDDDEDDDYVWENKPTVKPFDGDLRRQYLAYIHKINTSPCGAGDLADFVKDGVVHNDSAPMPVDEYARLISDSKRDLPELHFEVETLVVEKNQSSSLSSTTTTSTATSSTTTTGTPGKDGSRTQKYDGSIAARLKLTYKPTPATQDTFYEHVFYALEQGKISRVWSLLDGAGLKWKEKRDQEVARIGKIE
ncbi:uncharacterized protein Z520_06760 [Fonsecaea multimorphosa CBS 102226]|uniref:Uncharacterized protein n=1 Tax=Fonsecaea multimorphosa CBS 102226 TaxID=1442371 RepID=A0A0D2KL23_9EURO|nr:uncharacterized protein Z520_06760 [Fonsecaea multimorphosa CBS 102226]KIX97308.1 hypothetical protein Z520_06760 [Fonsecaea multimorphosa CBS 102226]